MPDILRLDYETKSGTDLKTRGLDRYVRDPEAAILIAGWRLNGDKLRHWSLADSERPPVEFRDALADPHVLKWAFNAQFERTTTRDLLGIKTPITSWRCTMALAYMHSFVGTLGEIGEQIGLADEHLKDREGSRLIRKFSVPQKKGPRWRNWETDPEDWEKFIQYCRKDVISEERVGDFFADSEVLPEEWRAYHLDQLINDRGLPVNLDFCRKAIAISNKRKAEIIVEMKEITGLQNPNSATQLTAWLRERGYPFQDIGKDTIAKVLREESVSDPDAVKVMKLRQLAGKTSDRKFKAILDRASDDGVVRYIYQFAGGSRTNRWAGRGVQTQNLARTPKLLEEEADAERFIETVLEGDYDWLSLLYGEPLEVVPSSIRFAFQTDKNTEFTVCDFSSIESVVIGWLADCPRILRVFREGRDLYKDFGTYWLSKKYEEITKAERNLCKPAVLGAGFRLGGGDIKEGKKTGLWGYAENMGVMMTRDEAHSSVAAFRQTYPEVVQLWFDIETIVDRVMEDGKPRKLGLLRFSKNDRYLIVRLPSGRRMYYFKPLMKNIIMRTGQFETVIENGELVQRERTWTARNLTYMGKDQLTGEWKRIPTHGGKLTENFVQAVARDVLRDGMFRAHEAGFKIHGHVHDEIKTIRIRGDESRSVEVLRDLLVAPISWAPGLPLGAAGWSGWFYRKD